VVISLCGFPLWLSIASPNGDLRDQWTDHLRHGGEAMAFEQRGLSLYTLTYDEATAGVTLPCAAHAGLWGQTGIPYPPLGVLVHWPVARIERAGMLTPATGHRLLTWLFGVAGLACIALGLQHLRGARRIVFAALFGPLLLGAGLSGFYDTLFVLAALLAIVTGSRALATLGYLLHFRGLVAVTFVSWRARSRATVLSAAAIVLNTVLAVIAFTHLGVFELNSRLHYSRPAAWWFQPVTAIVWWFVRKEPFGLPLLVTAVFMFVDRQVSFWHLLVLVPLAFSVLRDGSPRAAWLIIGWMAITAQAYLDSWMPFPVQWLTLR
jgi:hypothetical protein